MIGARRLIVHATVILSTGAGALAAGSTNWTGGGGDRQWANPANWSNGLPDADTTATFYGPDGTRVTVDLGGATRRAAALSVGTGIGSLITVTNGTLSTPRVDAISETVIESKLTSEAPTLELFANPLRVTGPIVGSMDVITGGTLAGINTYTGRTLVRTATEIGSGGVLLDTPLVQVAGRTLTFNSDLGFSIPSGVLELHNGHVVVAKVDGADRTALASGTSVFDLQRRFTTGELSRAPGATAVINPLTPGATVVPGNRQQPGVVPWVSMSGPAGESFGLLGETGFQPLTAADYAPDLTPGTNARLTGARTQSADVAVNTLTLNGAALQLNGARVAVTGGGLMFQSAGGNSVIRGTGSLALPDTEGVVHTFGSGNFHTIDVPVSGGMLTKTGPGRLVLARDNSYSGGTSISQGSIEAKLPGSLGSGPVKFGGGLGHLDVGYANGTLANDLVLDTPPGIDFDHASSLLVRPGTTTVAGRISGSGLLNFYGGDVRLAGGGAAEGAYLLFSNGWAVTVDSDLASPDSTIGTIGGATPGSVYGNGTLRGELRLAGGLVSPGSPGGATGRLTVGKGTFFGSTLHVDLAGRDPANGYDQLVVLDHLFLRTNLGLEAVQDLAPQPGFVPAAGDAFTLIDNRFGGPVDGYFRALTEGTVFTAAGTSWQITYRGGDGNDVVVTVVPEPGAIAGLAIGAPLLLRRRRHAGS